MARLTPEEFVAKHEQNTLNNIEEYRKGVRRVTQHPGKAAAAKKEKWLKGIQDAYNDGKWADNVSAGTLEDWQEAAATTGGDRIAGGLAKSRNKRLEFATQLLAHQDRYLPKIQQMPDTTFEQRLQRMTENAREAHKFRFRRTR